MYAEGPEPAIMPASLSCERDDNQKDCRAGHRSPGPMVPPWKHRPPCRPAATARQPASHHGARRRPASQVRYAQRARVAHRTAGPTAKAEQTVTRLRGRAPEREDLRAAARATATGVSRTD